jgi:hypothetical protein
MPSDEFEVSDFEHGDVYGTVIVKISDNKIKFGYRADLYFQLINMVSSDVVSSNKGDEFTIPNVPRGTFRAIVEGLSDHPSKPWFKFTPGGFCR